MKWIKSVGTFISPLFTEKEDDGTRKLSLGRIAFWITFGIAVFIWTTSTGDITASHMQMLYVTTSYNLLKKTTWFGSIKTENSQLDISHEAEKDPYDEVKPPRV